MSILAIRLPEHTHERLTEIARTRRMSVNKLLEELSASAIVQHDAETRFRAFATRDSVEVGLDILNKLDDSFREPTSTSPVMRMTIPFG